MSEEVNVLGEEKIERKKNPNGVDRLGLSRFLLAFPARF